MTDAVAVTQTDPHVVSVVPATQYTITVNAGVQGPPGALGGGDMVSLVYDPTGVADDCFDAGNLSGSLDCGVFT